MAGRARTIELPKVPDRRGNLTFIEAEAHVPFEIRRVYWTYDVPGGARRGGHAYRRLEELLVALSGSFDVVLFDGEREERFVLNRGYVGLYVPPMTWRELDNFSTNAMCLVVASRPYEESDYIRDRATFAAAARGAPGA